MLGRLAHAKSWGRLSEEARGHSWESDEAGEAIREALLTTTTQLARPTVKVPEARRCNSMCDSGHRFVCVIRVPVCPRVVPYVSRLPSESFYRTGKLISAPCLDARRSRVTRGRWG